MACIISAAHQLRLIYVSIYASHVPLINRSLMTRIADDANCESSVTSCLVFAVAIGYRRQTREGGREEVSRAAPIYVAHLPIERQITWFCDPEEKQKKKL